MLERLKKHSILNHPIFSKSGMNRGKALENLQNFKSVVQGNRTKAELISHLIKRGSATVSRTNQSHLDNIERNSERSQALSTIAASRQSGILSQDGNTKIDQEIAKESKMDRYKP